jgi:hypothetical protein
MALAAGTVAFGWHPLRLPGTGVQLPAGTAAARLAVVLGYVLVTELVVAGLAFLLSVSTGSALGAVGGAAAWYWATRSAGTRPRSLTSSPCAFAQPRTSVLLMPFAGDLRLLCPVRRAVPVTFRPASM